MTSEELQRRLEESLRHHLSGKGSILFKLTWKEWVTPSGVKRSRLRASAHNSSATAPTGMPKHLPRPSGTSNHGRNHVAGRLDEWGGSSNPFRGTPLGKTHSPSFELWTMGYPDAWAELMPRGMQSSRSKRRPTSNAQV